jgi:cell fate regulator YaaT (PSP1 superfamily)
MVSVVGVRFKKAGKVYYFDPGEFSLSTGMKVVVETARGIEYGEVAVGPKEIPEEQVVQPLKKVIRPGTERDALIAAENKRREKEAFSIALKKIEAHSLEMNLVDVEYTFDASKIIFYFTADGRVDFRELVRDLASVFRTRIEMRQIGVRDEAKLLGGIGPCGRILCCTSFLGDFAPVSIRMAKDQNLSLNPSKISGLCGRLMCCLRYEQETYEAAKKDPTLAPGYVPPVILEEPDPDLEELEDRAGPRIGIGVQGHGESGVSARIARAAGLMGTEPTPADRRTERAASGDERRADKQGRHQPHPQRPHEVKGHDGKQKEHQAKQPKQHQHQSEKHAAKVKPPKLHPKAKPGGGESKHQERPHGKADRTELPAKVKTVQGHPKQGAGQPHGQAVQAREAQAREVQADRHPGETSRESRRHRFRRHRKKGGGGERSGGAGTPPQHH